MLTPNFIPSTEPEINVGIILPEDGYREMTLMVPGNPSYSLDTGETKKKLTPGQVLKVTKSDRGLAVDLDGTILGALERIEIRSETVSPELQPREGIIVEDVIAGRGFHWKKYIRVHLPGHVRIVRHEDVLLLINILPLEHYVMCVATSEMGAACPDALIESQTVAARTWMLANVEQKHRDLDMDVCNDDCCQRYQGSTHLSPQSVRGALNTYGQVLIHEGKICDARYSKSCGGMMERFENIWEGAGHPYLRSLPDSDGGLESWADKLDQEDHFRNWADSVPPAFCSSSSVPESTLKQYLGSVDEQGQYFRWTVEQTQEELTDVLNMHMDLKAEVILDLLPLKRGGSGRIIKLRLEYRDRAGRRQQGLLTSEFDIRKSLHRKFLYSSAMYIEKLQSGSAIPTGFIFHGAGWGHGVGLCQIGALGMALRDFSTEQILSHYYPGSTLQKIYE